MTTLDEILKKLSSNRDTLRAFKVKKIGVFGSCARNENREGSDIDLLVALDEAIGLFELMDLEEYLETLLGSKVDLVTEPALKPYIGKRIRKEVVYP